MMEPDYFLYYCCVEGSDLKKPKVEHLKAYLRNYGLRMVGVKAILLSRVQEHLRYNTCISSSYTTCNVKVLCKLWFSHLLPHYYDGDEDKFGYTVN